MYLKAGLSEFQVRNVKWNALWSQISSSESWEILSNTKLKIQNGGALPEKEWNL